MLWLGSLVALGALMVASLGQIGMAAAVYCGVAAMMLFRFGVAVSIVLAIATLVVVSGEAVPGWDRSLDLAFATCAAGLAVFGISSMMRRNVDLIRAHEENAELLVENERTRFARDLHDILGHSLTVITVKAELAGRLMDADPARAKAEVADLERLSRDALADVRRAVEGYRDLTLPGELARARRRWKPRGSVPTCRTPPTRCRPTCASCSPGPSARASPTSSVTPTPQRAGWSSARPLSR